ncbi:hypothetical protein B0H13DRAFT_2361108 [Mycena leptocephala]|nr:hypothetical protein B0H13DRAFT_2361108 [Mycena leptocephala]
MQVSGIAAVGAEDPTSAQAVTSAAAAGPGHHTPHGYYTFYRQPRPCPAHAPPRAPAPATVSAPAPVVNGIPPGLAALLRHTGPWEANQLYSVPPTGPLSPVEEITPAPEWYCVTRGRFVGVMDQ